jgi:hypothetical protein
VGVVAKRVGGDSAAAAAAGALPGVGSLGALAGLDPGLLSPSDLVDAVIASERLLAHVNFLQARLLAELGRPQRCGDVTALVAALVDKAGAGRRADGVVDDEVVAELTADRSIGVAATEVAAVLDWSPVTARIRINQSMRLETALPKTLAALRSGRVDVGRVRMIVDRTAVLSPQVCRQVEGRILKWVKGRSKARLETLVDREVILADPAAAENRRVKAVKDRNVSHRVERDGMGVITALLPAESAVLVFTLVDLIAAASKGLDGRSVDHRRADAIADIADELLTFGFVDLHGLIATADRARTATATASASASAGTTENGGTAQNADAAAVAVAAAAAGQREPAGPSAGVIKDADRAARLSRAMSRHGRRPHLNVTGAWTTLAGWDDLPGHLDGHGVITAPLLRSIAASWATLTAVGVDPVAGTATAIGTTTYRPRQGLGDQVILLSGTCRMPSCRIPAYRCDLDHVDPFDHQDPAAGGRTTLGNIMPMCKFHHLLKHHTDWTPHLQPDLSIHWTTTTGHEAISHPREFTLPGEWDRPPPPAKQAAAEPHPPAEPDCPDPGEKTAHSPNSAGPVIIGPTITGPTIPVIPPGTTWTEPNTELQDPDTIPHPGSIEIHTYRTLRQQTREHSLRRLGSLHPHPGPTEQHLQMTENLNNRALLERSVRPSRAVQPVEDQLPTQQVVASGVIPGQPPF